MHKPIIGVEIQKRNGKKIHAARTLALIDSGADNCIFHAELGEQLGIDIKSGEYAEIGGIAKDENEDPKIIQCWKHPIGLKVGGEVRNIEAMFSPDIADHGFAILGSIGFFDKFTSVRLDYNEDKIIIRP